MARRSLWCLVGLLLALLFVTANGLRGPASQVEGHETRTTPRGRGGSRFNLKASEGLESSTTPFSSSSPGSSRARSGGRRGGSRAGEAPRSEAVTPKSRLDHDRDAKFPAGNSQKSSGSAGFVSGPERRRPSSGTAARKSPPEISQRATTEDAPTTEVYKPIKKIERANDSPISKDNQEPRRIGLFRARNGSPSKRGSTTAKSAEDSGGSREFDTTGPSVFAGTTEIPRSRTGRKIQTTLSSRDLKSGLPTSGRYASARQNAEKPRVREEDTSGRFDASPRAQRRSSDLSAKRRHDVVVHSGSESVSIDIPLISELPVRSRVHNSSEAVDDSASSSSPRNGRGRSRGRSAEEKSTESSTSRSGSRRGSSRFAEAVPVVNNSLERPARARSESHSRGNEQRNEKSRSRGRGQESTASKSSGRSDETKGRSADGKGSAGRRDRTAGARSTAAGNRSLESEARGRSRIKSRATVTSTSPPATTAAPEETTTIVIATAESVTSSQVSFAPTTTPAATSRTVQERSETTVEPSGARNRGRTGAPSTTSKKAAREDFFNHGLGFRGRKVATEAPSEPSNTRNEAKSEAPPRGNPGWTLKRRPGYHAEDVSTTSSRPSATTESGAATISNEIPTANENSPSTISSTSDGSKKARGSKRPSRPTGDADGAGKTSKKTSGQGKANRDSEESDNYPPEFKAKLAQLKNGNGQDATAKPVSGGLFKKRPTTDPQYVARSRQKLDSAVKLVLKSESSDEDRNRKTEPTSSSTPSSFATKKRPEATRRSKVGSKLATTVKSPAESKIHKFAKRFGPSKTTLGTAKFTGPIKLRKSKEATEPTTLSEIDGTNDLIESTTLPYSRDAAEPKRTEATTATPQPTRHNILSRRAKELPRENVPTTTRKPRAWIAQHIDKNFEEPRSRDVQESSTRRSGSSTTTKRSRAWIAQHIDKNFEEPRSKDVEESSTRRSASSTTTKKSRVWNLAYIDRDWQEPTRRTTVAEASSTRETRVSATARGKPEVAVTEPSFAENAPGTVSADGRYTRKKTEAFKPFESVPKIGTTEESSSSRRREFRPRTATYRRHSEPPQPVFVVNALPVGKSSSGSSVAITPKAPVKFHATVRGSAENSTPRLARQEPTLNVKISDESENSNTSSGGAASGIVGSSNGASGTSDSNIFSPTRSTFLLSSNSTFLDQLRSTVAPLLNALGNRTPIFSTVYNATNGTDNSAARVTPSGSPPRFSARYKGAELFVRRPNVLEPAGPFITSSTTPFTPTENSGSAPPVSIESPGEPRVLTFYQALESASISNELGQTDEQQARIVGDAQVDVLPNAAVNDSNDTSNSNNDTITTIPTTRVTEMSVESVTMDVSSLTTIETTQMPETTVRQDDATQSLDVATILPETTEPTRADTTVPVEENPSTTPLAEPRTDASIIGTTASPDDSFGTTPETSTQFEPAPELTTETSTRFESTPEVTTESSTRFEPTPEVTTESSTRFEPTPEVTTETSTRFEPTPEVTTETSASTETVTEPPTIQNTIPEANANFRMTAVPSITERAYSDIVESSSMTTEPIGDVTAPSATTEVTNARVVEETATTTQQNDESTTSVTGGIVDGEVDSSSSANSELDATTTVQPSSESASTIIATTAESVTTLQPDKFGGSTPVPSDTESTSTEAQITTSTDAQITTSTDAQITTSSDVQTTTSNDAQTTTINDAQMPTSNDVQMPTSNDVQMPTSSDAQITTSNDVQMPTSNDVQMPTSNDVQMPTSNDAQITTSNDAQIITSTEAQITTSIDVQMPTSSDAQITTSNDVQMPTSTDAQITTSNDAQITTSTEAQITTSIDVQTTASNDVQTTTINDAQMPTSNDVQMPTSNDVQMPTSTDAQITTSNDVQMSTTDGVSNLEVTVEMATATLQTTVPTAESTEASTPMIASETSTMGTLEVTAQLVESAATPQVTQELEVTSSTTLANSSDSQTADVTTSSVIPSTESSLRSRITLDDIGARLGNYTEIPSLSDNSLLSRMMIRLMTTLFSDSSEETGSSSGTPSADVATARSDVDGTSRPETAGQSPADEVPQLLGGFLDNTDKNATGPDTGPEGLSPETASAGTPSPMFEPQSTQPPETTPMITEPPITEPVVTSTRVTTPSTTPVTLSPLEETTLTVESGRTEDGPGVPEDLTSNPAMDDTNFTTNQPSESTLTTSDTVERSDITVGNETGGTSPVEEGDVEIIGVTTVDNGVTSTNNNVPDMTTPITETSPEPENDDPNSLAGLQDTTTATAQRTAGDDAQATSRPEQTTDSVTTPIPETTTTVTETTTSITTTETQPSTTSSTTTETSVETSTIDSATTDTQTEQITTAPETTTAPMDAAPATSGSTAESPAVTTNEATTIGMDTATMANLMASTESSVMTTLTTMAMMNSTVETSTAPPATSMAPPATSTAPPATSMAPPATSTTPPATSMAPPATSTTPPATSTAPPATSTAPPTTPYLGRFGNSRITPAPRFSVSSSTTTPLRDYLVYGIYPNKTIVRKRPEDNLIDARNVDSPYVIFGIFPDGRLVRKFPNGTVIPDPPTNPVEVVFSLKTTTSTTNRPRPPVFTDNRQSNPGYYYNQNAALYNNRGPSILASPGGQPGGFPSQVDLGLTGNAIGPGGEAPNFIASQPSGTKMTDSLLNTETGTASRIAGVLTTTSSSIATDGPPASATPSNVNPQGGRIIQDRERDEASRSREAGGQRSTVYIGQEKFINYWSNGNTTNNNSRLVSVKINSVARSLNEGPASSSGSQQLRTSFDILPNSEPNGGPVTAPPGFPWKDPLDQIFGITTESQVITASIASNTLDDSSPSRPPTLSGAINPLVEVFGRLSSSSRPLADTVSTSTTTTSAPTTTTTTTTTPAPTTTTTTPAPTTTTTTPAPTTTTTTPAPTTSTTTTTTTPAPTTTTTTAAPTTTTTTTTTTPAPTTTTTTTTTTPAPTTTTTTLAPTTTTTTAPTSTTAIPTTMNLPKQTAFGTTFNDLAFLNSLLQAPTSKSSTPKTLTEVEQFLANKILSLALGNPGPTRSPKAIQSSNVSPNSVFSDSTPGPSSRPIIIDLLQTTSTTRRAPIPRTSTEQFTWRPVTIVTPTITTAKPTEAPTTTTARPATTTAAGTEKPVIITARTVTTARPRPRTTQAPAPQGFGASLLQSLFGGNFFGTPTTQRPVQTTRRPVQTTRKPTPTTTAPIRTTQAQPPLVQEVHVTPRNVEASQIQSNTPNSLGSGVEPITSTSTARTSTYSSAEDEKFLAALLKAAGQPATGKGDEAILRALLNGQASVKPTQTSSTASPQSLQKNEEAFLRALLNGPASVKPGQGSSTGSSQSNSKDDEAFLRALLNGQAGVKAAQGSSTGPSQSLPKNDEAILRALLNGQASVKPTQRSSTASPQSLPKNEEAFLRALLNGQAIVKPAQGSPTGSSQSLPNNDEAFLRALLNGQASVKPTQGSSTGSSQSLPNNDEAFLRALLNGQASVKPTQGSSTGSSQSLPKDDQAFLRSILNGQASVKPAQGSSTGISDAALLAALLKAQGIEPSTPANRLREQLQSVATGSTTTTTTRPRVTLATTKKPAPTRPRVPQTTWSPSSTYPPPLFSNFGNFGSAQQNPRAETANAPGDGNVRSQVFNAAIGATRAFSQFLGAAITGAAQQLQSFVRNGTS